MKNFKKTWITSNLQKEIRYLFEPRYQRKLSQEEIVEIANNLTCGIESILKLKTQKLYGK